MKNIICLIIVLSMCVLQVYAQLEIQPGFIINYQQDTIYGLIDIKGDINSANICYFRTSKESAPIKYTPENILAYRYTNGKYYLSKILPQEKKIVFLEYLINGMVDLYYYRDEKEDHFYIQTDDSDITELYDDEKIVYREGKSYKLKSEKYKNQLKYVFHDKPELHDRIDRLTLSQKSLLRLFQAYHQLKCQDDNFCILYQKQLPKSKLVLGALGGINFYAINIVDHKDLIFTYTEENINYRNDDPIKHESTTHVSYPTFGLFINRSLPYVHKNLSLQYEVAYQRQKFTSSYSYPHRLIRTEADPNSAAYMQTLASNEISLDITSLSHTIMFKYELNTSLFYPIIYIGGFLNTHINSSYEQEFNFYNTSEEHLLKFNQSDKPMNENKFGAVTTHGLTCGVGTRLRIAQQYNLFTSLRYQRGFEMLGFKRAVSNNIFVNFTLPILY